MEQMIYSRKLTCPVCANKFNSMKVMESKLRVEETDTDLFTRYKGDIHPLRYNAIVCPNCGNSALEENFKNMSARKKEIIKEKVTPKWSGKNFTKERSLNESIVCFKLALYCAEITGAKKAELAGICLKTAWLYRIKKDEKETKFLGLAARLYEESFSEEDNIMDELTLLYLIGEINRRLGEMDKAIQWIGKVISNPYIKNNPKIERLARDQWETIKEFRSLDAQTS